tara:strand:- start:1597 stop:1773 length:177 start_codon:yes stop_codon:yes gene_type:complete
MKKKYLIEYKNVDGTVDEVEITTDDITKTLEQYARNRSILEYTKVEVIDEPKTRMFHN